MFLFRIKANEVECMVSHNVLQYLQGKTENFVFNFQTQIKYNVLENYRHML